MTVYLRQLQDEGHTDRDALDLIATKYFWEGKVLGRSGGDFVVAYTQPSGLTVNLIWENGVLTGALRGTKVSKVEAHGDRFSEPELVKIAAMFLEDNE